MYLKQKGFTLVELLVVIAIIGILAQVVLSSVNIARGKGIDTTVKASFNGIRSEAEIVYDNNSQDYTNVCIDPNIVLAISNSATKESFVWASTADNNVNVNCYSSSTQWMVYIDLAKVAGTWWCLDNTGQAKAELSSPTTAATSCP